MELSWNLAFAALALGMVLYAGRSLLHERQRQDFFLMLLGIYLLGLQLPLAVPAIGVALGVTCPLGPDYLSRLTRIAPAAALFFLATAPERSS